MRTTTVRAKDVPINWLIIDASDQILGRVAAAAPSGRAGRARAGRPSILQGTPSKDRSLPSKYGERYLKGIHFAIDGLDWKTQAPQREQLGFKEQVGEEL